MELTKHTQKYDGKQQLLYEIRMLPEIEICLLSHNFKISPNIRFFNFVYTGKTAKTIQIYLNRMYTLSGKTGRQQTAGSGNVLRTLYPGLRNYISDFAAI
jgi:hypothetical protein